MQGADIALLSGSGATVFGIFSRRIGARRAQAHFAGTSGSKSLSFPLALSQ